MPPGRDRAHEGICGSFPHHKCTHQSLSDCIMFQTVISETRSKTPNHAICQSAQSSEMPICMFCKVLQGPLQLYTLLVLVSPFVVGYLLYLCHKQEATIYRNYYCWLKFIHKLSKSNTLTKVCFAYLQEMS